MRLPLALLLVGSLISPAMAAEDALASDLRAEAQRRASADEFSGSVLVARNGMPIFQGAYGYANRERKLPNALDTRFRFGSMGKMFTAVAVMQLVQAGKIALDAPLARYLTDYPNKEIAAVTIEQLLTHTGGTGNIFEPEYFERRLETREHQDYIELFGARGPAFEPGSRWDYSNYGMLLLGRVIEVVSGQSYYDYTRMKIFEPLEMTATGNEPEERHVPGLSTGYTRTGRPNTEGLPYRGTAAGGGYTTVGDLLRFMNGLTSNRLLDAVHTGLLLRPRRSTARPGAEQALGFSVRTSPDGVVSVGHGGGAPGMNGELMYFPGSGYLVVVLANVDPPVATDLAVYIRERIGGAKYR